MQSFVLLVLLMTLVSCTDSGSRVQPPDVGQTPTAQPSGGTTITDPVSNPPTPPTVPSVVTGISSVPQLGENGSFEFGAWNIQNFPKSNRTPAMACEIIKRIDVDLMAFEEIASIASFQEITTCLAGYASVLSPHIYSDKSYQKLGFAYRQSDLDLLGTSVLFDGQEYEFPRPPFQAHFRIKVGAHAGQEIYFIAVHLKATDEGNSQARREVANEKLEAHVANLMSNNPGVQVVLLGDFNERANYAAGLNVFKPWLSKPDAYTFQTKEMAQREYTYLWPQSMIDHMISTRNVEMNPITVPKLETMIESYRDLVSDHLPVIARMR